jgi:hypothetical protein
VNYRLFCFVLLIILFTIFPGSIAVLPVRHTIADGPLLSMFSFQRLLILPGKDKKRPPCRAVFCTPVRPIEI